jgi:hypothetical protein
MRTIRTYLIISLLVSVVGGLMAMSNISQATKASTSPSSIITTEVSGMNSYIQLTGHQLIIINKNHFDWTNVHLKLVSDLGAGPSLPELDKRYEVAMTLPKLPARSTFTVAAGEWGNDHPGQAQLGLSTPSHLSIQCDTPYGVCTWSGRWK